MTFLISVKAIAGAKKTEVIDNGINSSGRRDFKVKVNQPPENGKANQAIIEIIADYFKIKKNDVKIISGELSKNKIIEIKNVK